MALNKAIIQEDGVTCSYHRVQFCQITTNQQNSIVVLSYVDAAARENEKNGTIQEPYRKSITYETTYDNTMNIDNAYAYLKTLPEFEGATDI